MLTNSVHVDAGINGIVNKGDYIITNYCIIQPTINPNYLIVEVTRID
jgi:hypothetical protein